MEITEIRRLSPEEHPAARAISDYCFHARLTKEEEKRRREEIPKDLPEDWGAFSPDGTLMAHVIRNVYQTRFDGGVIQSSGIGAVSTLPEYRESGAIRAIFEKLLPAARAAGDVISNLYPFNHGFYRKFGYETLAFQSVYSFPPAALGRRPFSGWARLRKEGDPSAPYEALYSDFSSRLNLMTVRTPEMMKEHLSGGDPETRRFTYLLGEGDEPLAYLVFRDLARKPQAVLSVEDLAFRGQRGFQALLGFLSRFSADYGKISLILPTGLELAPFLASPYDAKKETSLAHMIRLINAEKLLSALNKPEGARFRIRISDPIIPENDGTFLVSPEGVFRSEEEPDLILPQSVLALMAAGGASLYEASLRPDVEIRGNGALLEAVFVKKSVFLTDHF